MISMRLVVYWLLLGCYVIASAVGYKIEAESILRKPFVPVCDEEPPPDEPLALQLDQTEPECPLPFRSSSQQTGCTCDLGSKSIDCIYSNRLNTVPMFVESLQSQQSQQQHKSKDGQIEWNINLKCRNFTKLLEFKNFYNLKVMNLLDLSLARPSDGCKLSPLAEYLERMSDDPNIDEHERAAKKRALEEHQFKPVLMTHIGHKLNKQVDSSPSPSNKLLQIRKLDLGSNRVTDFYLNSQSCRHVTIRSISLYNNSLDQSVLLSLKNNIDICSIGLHELDLSFNRVSQIEISFLVYLSNLNLSSNRLSQVSIETFDSKDFKSYYNQTCGMKNIKVRLTGGGFELSSSVSGDENVTNTTESYRIFEKSLYKSNLVNLDLSHNYFSSVPFGFFLDSIVFDQLLYLNMSFNRLKKLTNSDFNQMKLLQHLEVKSNLIESLDRSIFINQINLRYVDLSFNFLASLPAQLFNHQDRTLEYLNLNNNYLTEIPIATFKRLGAVKHLHLSQNRIKVLRNYSFGYMSSLYELYLAHNLIERIEPMAFSIDERSFMGPGLVEKLDLTSNRIDSLNASVFYYLTNLRYLLLSDNRIRHVDYHAFKGVSYMISLDLSLNRIQQLDFLYNRNFSMHLRFLKLSNNQLTHIGPVQFGFLNSLGHLDLSANRIFRLADCAFHGIQDSIRQLILNYNRIRRVNSCAFSIDFRHLRIVQLLHNPINCSGNCEFFYAIYNPPYSISYQGIECTTHLTTSKSKTSTTKQPVSANRTTQATKSNQTHHHHHHHNLSPVHCTREQYESIQDKCKNRFVKNSCSSYLELDEEELLKRVKSIETDTESVAKEDLSTTTSEKRDKQKEYDELTEETDDEYASSSNPSGNKVNKLVVKPETLIKNNANSKQWTSYSATAFWLFSFTVFLIR